MTPDRREVPADRLKVQGPLADSGEVGIVFWGFAALLAAAGGVIVGAGVDLVVTNRPGPAALGLAVGLLAFYGSYLFGRTAWRLRVAERTGSALDPRKVRATLISVALSVAWVVFAPLPGGLKAVGVLVILLGAVVGMAIVADPPKLKR